MEKPKRPWWHRRWVQAIVVLWLCLPLYVFATGPVLYAELRGWVPTDTYVTVFHPLYRGVYAFDGSRRRVSRPLSAYTNWWANLSPTFRNVRISHPYP